MTRGKRWRETARLGAAAGGVAAALALLLEAEEARAEGKGQVVAVVVEGAYSGQVAGWLEDRITAPDTLKEEHAFRAALRARGALPLRRDGQVVARARAAAKDAGVDRVVLVDVRKTARATRVHVWDVDVHEVAALVDGDINLPASASAVDTSRAILGLEPPRRPKAVETNAPPAPAPATPAASESDVAPSPTPAVAADPAAPEPDRVAPARPADVDSSLFSLRAALGVGMRHFSYTDRITQTLRPYDLAGAPLAQVSGVVFPLARSGIPVARDLGITGAYGRAVALSSQDSAGNHVDTTWQSFDVGAVERIALGPTVIADVGAGYGGNDFQFNQSLAGGPAALPSVAYRFVRVGADLRWRVLPALTATAGGSYLDVLSSGYTAQLFPRESVGGVEGRLGASYALTRQLAVSLSATYTRMFYSFNPVPGDASVAGGAVDEQSRVVAGVAWVM